MPGPRKAWKTKPRFPTLSTALENPAGDFHISTAPATTMLTESKSKKGRRPLRGLPFSVSALPPVGRPYFMLILGLENAGQPAMLRRYRSDSEE
jgi:hypothetical protein